MKTTVWSSFPASFVAAMTGVVHDESDFLELFCQRPISREGYLWWADGVIVVDDGAHPSSLFRQRSVAALEGLFYAKGEEPTALDSPVGVPLRLPRTAPP